jgi:hypothetical protein
MIQYSSINDAWGNKEIYKKNTINNIDISKQIDGFKQKVETFVNPQPVQKVETFVNPQPVQKVETFVNPQPIIPNNEHFVSTTTLPSTCNFAEHFKTCEHCRNSLSEYFENNNTSSLSIIDIFGLKINITKDVLRVIFVIIIVLIFIIILSTINVSLQDTKMHMKYYMMPQMHNMPYYH